jgi:Holliday junction resolvase-like predicted endonuclease
MSNPDGVTVFIEVKTRALSRRGNQQDWHEAVSHTINWRKQKKILSAARAYKIETAEHGSECRFDVIMLGLSSDLAALLVHKNADSELHTSESIDLEASRLIVDKASSRARLIHCENVFVTNF